VWEAASCLKLMLSPDDDYARPDTIRGGLYSRFVEHGEADAVSDGALIPVLLIQT
jgi:hypothetical protein